MHYLFLKALVYEILKTFETFHYSLNANTDWHKYLHATSFFIPWQQQKKKEIMDD